MLLLASTIYSVISGLAVSLKLFASTLCRFLLGCSRKNPQPHDGWDSGNSRGRGGQILWKSRREGGLNLKKSSAGVILTDNSCDSNVKFSDSSSLSDPENSTNILFRYFSPDKNDNLSSFAGPFIAEMRTSRY